MFTLSRDQYNTPLMCIGVDIIAFCDNIFAMLELREGFTDIKVEAHHNKNMYGITAKEGLQEKRIVVGLFVQDDSVKVYSERQACPVYDNGPHNDFCGKSDIYCIAGNEEQEILPGFGINPDCNPDMCLLKQIKHAVESGTIWKYQP